MINKNDIQHILISRTDNIGDVVLTLPMAAMLKQQFPDVKISFLAREYVRGVLEHCEHVDEFYSWDALSQLHEKNEAAAIAQIQSHQFDTVIHVFPRSDIATLMRRAKIKYRVGTTHRLYHWWTCNERVNFSRAKSNFHEVQLNLKLLKPFNNVAQPELHALRQQFGLRVSDTLSVELKKYLREDRFNLIVHPFTNGNTREWPVSHFNALIRQLSVDKFNVMITGSSKEVLSIQERMMPQCPRAINLAGKCSLRELMELIGHADGLIANSTGPMHIAAALGVHTLGLFPVTRGIDPNRWGPVGMKTEFLIADPNCQLPRCRNKNDCFCMESITVESVKNKVMGWVADTTLFKEAASII